MAFRFVSRNNIVKKKIAKQLIIRNYYFILIKNSSNLLFNQWIHSHLYNKFVKSQKFDYMLEKYLIKTYSRWKVFGAMTNTNAIITSDSAPIAPNKNQYFSLGNYIFYTKYIWIVRSKSFQWNLHTRSLLFKNH